MNKDTFLGWLAISMLAIGGALGFMRIGFDIHAARSLPTPPDLTPAEMKQREIDYVGDHLQTCKVCGTVDPEYDLENYCDEYIRLTCEAKIVGDWCMIGVVKQTGRVIWEYVGRPHPGWVWSELLQCWRQVRRVR